jgi:predicted NUDIX family NTP pyrophosphohydrolase
LPLTKVEWMPRPHSAGILLFRDSGGGTEVLLVKPGGPFWRNKHVGAWMIPKGGLEPGETAVEAALREFAEETGTTLTSMPFPLATVRQSGGKCVEAFAVAGDLDPARFESNCLEVEWPPRSGRRELYAEIAEARWMTLAEARELMLPSQLPLLDALEQKLAKPR